MYAIAIIGDLVGVIPIVNIFSDLITAGLLGLVGSVNGVSLYSPDKIFATGAVAALKFIPGVSIIPAWTIRVYFAKRAAQRDTQH